MDPGLKFDVRKEALSVRDVFERYQHSLPVIIQVTQGHHGDIDMDTFSTGHVMRVHTCSKQKRMVAKDNSGRHLSIPIDYPIKFRVSKNQKKAGQEYILRQIMEQNMLPLKVELCLPKAGYSLHIGHSIKQAESFGILHLLENYEETYLLANTIIEGTLDEEVLFVPIYLQNLVVATVSGIENKTESEFKYLQKELNSMADRAISYNTSGGNDDIAVYSPESVSSTEHMYDYIEPQHFIKYCPTKKRKSSVALPNVQELLVKLEQNLPRRTSLPKSGIYGDTPTLLDGACYQHQPDDFPPPIPDRPVLKSFPNEACNTDASTHVYVNNIGLAMIKPMEKPLVPKKPQETLVANLTAVSPPAAAPTMSTTAYVKDFTINDLAETLLVLKLGKYVDVFKDAQITGDLLLDLNVEMLKEDFEMKSYEAVKLMKYARTGYIPR